MIKKEQNGIYWLEFELLTEIKTLKHGVFLRHGGQSQGAFASLNLSYFSGDNEQHVTENLNKVKAILNVDYLAKCHLVHGTGCLEIRDCRETTVPECDALTTACRHIGLLITHADCQAAIIYDPIHHAIANVHAGWRGSVKNIYAEVVRQMACRYKSRPEDLIVGISPSLGPQDAEFIHFEKEIPKKYWKFQTRPNYFDFWNISRSQLEEIGVLPHHIEIAEISTFSNPEDFFSYRREKISGRHGTITMLH